MSSTSADVDEDFMRRAGRLLTIWLGIIVLAGLGLIFFSDSFLATFA
jgi:hypothetical protein